MGYPARDFDYLALDDFEDLYPDKPRHERWELIGGRLVRRPAGARWEHGRIVGNIVHGLDSCFEASGSPCRTFAETFYLKSEVLASALLPDVMVVSGDLKPGITSVDDAVVLGEVYTPGTEARDRFEKWAVYRQLASLRHYVLVSRDRPHLEVYDRIDDTWSGLRERDGLDATLELPAIDMTLPLADIYWRVITA